MGFFPSAGAFAPQSAQNVDIAALFEDWLATNKKLPGGAEASYINIVGGSITPTAWFTAVDVEGGSVSGLETDDLDQINPVNLPTGAMICLRPRATGRTVVLRHARGGAGQVFTPDGADFQMTDSSQHWLGVLAPDRLSWTEVARSWGDQKQAQRDWLGLGAGATMEIPSEPEIRAGTRNDRVMTPLGTAIALGDAQLAFIGRPFVTTFDLNDQMLVLREISAGNYQIRRTGLSILLSQTLTKVYESAELGLGAGAGGTIATHNLGGKPTSFEYILRCKVAEHSYAVGEELPYLGDGFSVAANTIGAFYRFGNEANPIKVRNKGSGTLVDATNGNWRMLFRLRR